ncbi:bifunctional adenosylcobinamide kinase/adenosylcobinamide-phosphate guanylyltransferase [Novipirellula caenicola]|uniref:Adenosylcobinamide kinase n=1 Tax=Novipirellula caenicola TaxID=1536901 RepID=A0ABP9VPC9_9BACT
MLHPQRKGTLTLVLGGVRSGKSQFAHSLALELGHDDVLFVATAEVGDQEMLQRIELHRRSRPATWQTLERTRGIGKTLAAMPSLPAVVLVDCLTLLTSNVMLSEDPVHDPLHKDNQAPREPVIEATDASIESRLETEVDELIQFAERHCVHLIVVSGEVGMGIVPEYSLGRQFRDLLGRANQTLAAHATATYLMVAGLPVEVSAIATTVQQASSHLQATSTKEIR